jgi:hypothetical protein
MNQLNKLIGLKVEAYYKGIPFKGIVIDYAIVDEYFYEKNEEIYLTINLSPIEEEDYSELMEEYGSDDINELFNDIPLDCIRFINQNK